MSYHNCTNVKLQCFHLLIEKGFGYILYVLAMSRPEDKIGKCMNFGILFQSDAHFSIPLVVHHIVLLIERIHFQWIRSEWR